MCLMMPFCTSEGSLKHNYLLFGKYFPGVMRETLTTPRNPLLCTSGIPQAHILPDQLQAQADVRSGTPQGNLCPSRSVTPQSPIALYQVPPHTQLPLPATCQQTIITLVRKPNHHLTTVITFPHDTHSRTS